MYRRSRAALRWSASPSDGWKRVVIRSRAIRRSIPRCRRFAIRSWTVPALKILRKSPMVSYPEIAVVLPRMAARAVLVRFVGVAMLVYLALVIGVAIVRPEFWSLVAIFFVMLWLWGFSLSHAYVLTHDGISSSKR